MNIFELICVKAWYSVNRTIRGEICLLPCSFEVRRAINESLSRKTFPEIGNTINNYQTKSLK